MESYKVLLHLLSETSLEELQTNAEIAYTQECLRYCDAIMVHGQGNLPKPLRLQQLWELNCDIKELGAS